MFDFFGITSFIVYAVLVVVVFVLIIRLFGAWMLRINEVIDQLEGIREEVKHLRLDLNNLAEEESTVKGESGGIDERKLAELKSKLKTGDLIVQDNKSNALYIMSEKQYAKDIGNNDLGKYKVIFQNKT